MKGRRLQEDKKLFIDVGQKIGPVMKSAGKKLKLSGAYRQIKESKGVFYTEWKFTSAIELLMPVKPGESIEYKLSDLTKIELAELKAEMATITRVTNYVEPIPHNIEANLHR